MESVSTENCNHRMEKIDDKLDDIKDVGKSNAIVLKDISQILKGHDGQKGFMEETRIKQITLDAKVEKYKWYGIYILLVLILGGGGASGIVFIKGLKLISSLTGGI